MGNNPITEISQSMTIMTWSRFATNADPLKLNVFFEDEQELQKNYYSSRD
jgi:hypothetical protein